MNVPQLISDGTRERIPMLSAGNDVPLHAALTEMPVALLDLAPALDAAALLTGSRTLASASFWTMLGALASAGPTSISGALEFLRIPAKDRAKGLALRHAALSLAAAGLATASLLARRSPYQPSLTSLSLSATAAGALAYASYLGHQLVFREGIRVVNSILRAGDSQPASL
jgi:uncharacterized membrane protein